MATFVLVHGAWHGGWCWERIVPLLEAKGHRVIAPDLPGMGADRTPLAEVSLERWADFTADLVARAGEPAILVGHSRGGLVISEAAERVPDEIATLVYLTAFLLPAGGTLAGALAEGMEGTGASPGDLLVFSEDGSSMNVAPENVAPVFYNTTEPYWAIRAAASLVPEPSSTFVTPLVTSAARFGRVPRIYVECTEDCAIPIGLQRHMHAALPCRQVITMATDHSPFYSAPTELSGVLDGITLATG